MVQEIIYILTSQVCTFWTLAEGTEVLTALIT